MSQDPIPPERDFTAYHPAQPLQGEHRVARRYYCAPATLVVMRLPGSEANLEGWAHDLSGHGIGLNLPQSLAVNTTAEVRLRAKKPVGMLTLAARVVHATPQPNGIWRIGCAFANPLDPDLVEALL